ncbi:MAG: PKD domain-containing protein [Bacteroidetes bacterium]|nr:PKD domain-containing protein [Bacteroidota bacterium]
MMRFFYTLLFAGLLFPFLSFSQDYKIDSINGTTLAACAGRFVDAGGSAGGYGNNETYSTTICSDFSGAGNPAIKLYFWQFDVSPSDTMYIYDGLSDTDPLIGKYNNNNGLFLHPIQTTIMNWSGCLTVAFTSDGANTGAGWSAEISCIPLCQQVYVGIDASLTNPHVNDSGYIVACAQDTLSFVGVGVFPQNNILYLQDDTTSRFIWSFGDGTIDSGRFVHHHYDSIRGYDVQLTIIDQLGCTSMNALGLRVCLADDPIKWVQTPPAICQYDTITLKVGYEGDATVNLDPIFHAQSSSLRYDSSTFIPDGGALGGQCYNTYVTFNVFSPGQTIVSPSDINSVCINMEHSFVGDLEFTLICPNGQSCVVKTYHQNGGAFLGTPAGGTNDQSMDCISTNFCTPMPVCSSPACITNPCCNPSGTGWTYCWTMDNPDFNIMETYVNGSQMDSGSYQPDNSFANMVGCPLNGTWNIQVCDYWGIDNGWVFWWQLNLDPDLLPSNWGYVCKVDSTVWTGPYIIDRTDSTVSISPPIGGNQIYHLTLYDHFGCSYDTSMVLTVFPGPIPNLPPDTTICTGESATFSAQGGGSYLWSNGSNTSSQTVNPTDTTTYTVVVTSNGCSGYDTLVVNVNPIPVANAGPDTAICIGTNLTVHGSGGLQYLWNTGALTPDLHLQPSSTATYSLSVTSNGCSSTDEVTVTVNPLPMPDLGNDTSICAIDSILLNPGNFTSYLWSTGDNFPLLVTSTSGTYRVQVWNEFGCTRSDSMTLIVYPIPSPNMTSAPFNGCDPVMVTFTNQTNPPALQYTWYFGDGKTSNDENPLHTYTLPGLFTVILKAVSMGGCEATDTFPAVVRVYKTPTASFYPKPKTVSIFEPTVTFINESVYADKYSWDFGDGVVSGDPEPVHPYADTGYYDVTLVTTTGPGCYDTASAQVHVKGFFTFYIPNAFSPNDDGYNDFFGPKGEGWGKYKQYTMMVFNRWGEMIYQTNDPDKPWNGRKDNSGKICQDGQYIYFIKLQAEDESINEYKGFVILIR